MTAAQPSLFRQRDFRLLLAGQTTSQLGTQVSGVAVPLLAVLTLNATPFEVGLVAASSALAFAVIGLPAGAWLDRARRRPILVASDLARAVLLASIPVAAALGQLTIAQLVAVSLLSGLARVFFDVGYQSYLPTLIGRDRVLAGNSSMETIRASGQVVGPGIGGLLVSLVGAASVILIQAVTFVVSALCLLAVRTVEPPIRSTDTPPRLRTQIAEGLRFVAGNRILRATALASAAGNFAFAISAAVSMIFLSRTLGFTATEIGLIIAGGALAAMAGAALTPWLSRRVGTARIIWLSLALTAPIGVLVPFAQPGWWSAALIVMIAVGEGGQIVYAITNVSLRQQLCPDAILSRVSATMRVLIMGLFPLGALAGGLLGEQVGLRPTLLLAWLILMLSPLPVYLALRGVRDVAELPPWTRALG